MRATKPVQKRYSDWEVLREVDPKVYLNGRIKRKMLCKCTACNKTERVVLYESLTSGKSKACGCTQKEIVRKHNTKHGFRQTSLHKTYYNMLQRCYNIKFKQYKDYGGRGIKVCKAWRDGGLGVFGKWAMESGYRQGLQLDRRKNNKGYSPNNCRWVTPTVNANNKRSNLYVYYNRTKYSFTKFYNEFNKNQIPYATALHRYKSQGFSAMDAVTLPLLKRGGAKRKPIFIFGKRKHLLPDVN